MIEFVRILLLFTGLLLAIPSQAQTTLLQGRVVDRTSQRGVAFASLGVKDQPLGSVANANGEFAFTVPTSVVTGPGQVLITCLGYRTVTIPLSAFAQGSQLIQLSGTSQMLREVVVRSGKGRSKTYGRTGSSTLMSAAMYTEQALVSDELGKEQGTVISIGRNCMLKDFNFHVAFNRFKVVTFRLNLYSVKKGLPDQPLLTQDVRFDVRQSRGWVKVDLTPHNLYLRGISEVAVTLQWLHSEAQEGNAKAFGVSAVPVPGHSILFRDKSQAQWREMKPGRLSFYFSAEAYDGSGENPSNTDSYAVPDSLKFLLDLASGNPAPPSSHHYGDSAAVGRYVEVAGARLYCETYGSGPPLLLLHGNGQSIAAFNQQISALAQQFRVIAVDTRLQGKSRETIAQELTYDLFAVDVRQLLDSFNLRRVSILGWSDGGNTALKLALANPGYVDRLVIMGANLFPTVDALKDETLRLFRWQLRNLASRTDDDAITRRRLLRLLLEQPQMNFDELRGIKAPTLVLAGQHDVVLEEHTRSIAEHITGSKLTIFLGATHFAPQEIAPQFNQRVMEFLRQP